MKSKKMNLDLYIHHRGKNSRKTMDANAKDKKKSFSHNNEGGYFHDFGVKKNFLNRSSKALMM
jgi:hypothetical protein